MNNEELSPLVKEYLSLTNQIEELTVLLNETKDHIKDYMDRNGLEETECEGRIVKWRSVLVSIFDKSNFKRKYEELYCDFLKQIETKKFTIS